MPLRQGEIPSCKLEEWEQTMTDTSSTTQEAPQVEAPQVAPSQVKVGQDRKSVV